MSGTVVDRGLEGIVVGATQLSNVEGLEGRLTYRGYDIHDLAPNVTFEEVVHLLVFGVLPNPTQLSDINARIGANRALPPDLLAMLKLIPKDAWPMDVLRTLVSALAHFEPHKPDGSHASNPQAALELIAKTPTIVAAWDRIRRGLEPVAPRGNLSTAADFLYMRSGELPIRAAEHALDMYFVLLADHSYNASTFAARVTASTRADIFGAATAAVATLAGDLHGGAPSKVMTMLLEVEEPERAEAYVRAIVGKGERVMGIGHREYRVRDPRALHLDAMTKQLAEASGTKWYTVARALEEASNKVLQEVKPRRRLFANVEFYTAPMLYSLGIPPDEFTCMFACSRMAGWCAHILEQLADNRLIRPQATYVGPPVSPVVPLSQRASANGTAQS